MSGRLSETEITSILDVVDADGQRLAALQPEVEGERQDDGTWVAWARDHNGIRFDVDASAEEALDKGMTILYPEAGFTGERLGRRLSKRDDRGEFHVDSPDGTAAFINDLHHYCTSLLFMQNNYPSLAIVHLPSTKHWYVASFIPTKDWAAEARLHSVSTVDGRLRVARAGKPTTCEVPEKDSYLWVSSDAHRSLDLATGFVGKTRSLGATATSLAMLSRGRYADPRAVAITRAKLHDVAAGLALCVAAGLVVTDLGDGSVVSVPELIDRCIADPKGRTPNLLVAAPGDPFAATVRLRA